MQIFRELAGYSLGRADLVRRAMSKKKHDVMQKEREIFIHGLTDENGQVVVEGCVRRGVSETIASAVFDEMASFASYAFNKSHAAAYALVAYQTAYLKAFYPKEYMAALLTSVLDSGKVAGYIGECERLRIRVLPPSVNESLSAFTVAGDHVRFGLLAVKNLGRGLIQELVAEREENGVFTGFYSFCQRMSRRRDFNRRALESLVRCGALDGLGANRRQMLEAIPLFLEGLEDVNRRNLDGQLDFFADPDAAVGSEPMLPDLPEFPYDELLAMEKEVSGLYLTGNPMKPYTNLHNRLHAARTDRILTAFAEVATDRAEFTDGQTVTLLGMIGSVQVKSTRNDTQMAYAVLEDMYGSLELVVFSRLLEQCRPLLRVGQVVVVRGRISAREDEEPRILAAAVEAAPPPDAIPPAPEPKPAQTEAPAMRRSNPGLYLRLPSLESGEWKRVRRLLRVFEGQTPVYLRLADTGKLMRIPADLWITPEKVLIGELERVLGKENVAKIW